MSNIVMTVTSPAGIEFRAIRIEGREEIGRSFEYEVALSSLNADIVANHLLGLPLSVKVQRAEGSPAVRYFHGIVSTFRYVGQTGRYTQYQVTLRPWSWILSNRANCRIFQNKTAVDIIKQVFTDSGNSDFDATALQGAYKARVYCVQYRESDLDFITRLMEREGIYYVFVHAAGKHTLKLLDAPGAHAAAPVATLPWSPGEAAREESFQQWHSATQLLTTKYRVKDYNFLNPQANLVAANIMQRSHGRSGQEVYDYPGEYEVLADGEAIAKIRLQEEQSTYDVSRGEGNICSLSAGETFALQDHFREAFNSEYMALSVDYVLDIGQDEVAAGAMPDSYEISCRVQAIPKSVNFRLASITPEPLISGPQTAVVVGPAGNEIFTDAHARVKLKFHWDLAAKGDDTDSCWVRVSQHWAGGGWGSIHIPRIGQEVVVEFLEGDPDRPLVTGRVYNASLMPPYKLSDNMTQSGIKTRSTPDGDASTFNELRFEDKKGSEEIYFHAEKDFNRVVENNDTLKVGFDKKDKGDQTIEIFNDQTITIGCDEAATGHRTTTLKLGNETLTINKGTRTVTLDEGDDTHQLKKGSRTVLVDEGDDTHQVKKGNRTVLVDEGNDTHTIGKGNREVTISTGNDTLTVKSGDQTITVTAGKLTIEAGTSIELKVGSNSLKITTSEIAINGAAVSVAATGEFKADGTAGAKLTSSAVVTVQGSLVKIN